MASKDVTSTDEFVKGLWRDNPVFVQVLGMCPALAVSNTAMNALAMGVATTFVLLAAGLSVSVLRNFIPREARIVCYISIIATFVTAVDYLIMALSLELHRALGAFIALIVVNCLILGRAEAFASKNPPGRALLDASGMGVGFTVALLFVGIVREILGSGSVFAMIYGVSAGTYASRPSSAVGLSFLPQAPRKRKRPMAVARVTDQKAPPPQSPKFMVRPRSSGLAAARGRTSVNSRVPKARKTSSMPRTKPKSPIRLVTNAFLPASAANFLS